MKKIILILFVISMFVLAVGCGQTQQSSAKTAPEVSIKSLTSAEKAKLSSSIDKIKVKSTKVSSSINSLNKLAKQKNDPKLTALSNKIKKIYSGSTITTLLDEVDKEIDSSDESLDEDSSKLSEEIDGLQALVNELVNYAKTSGDAFLIALVTSLDTEVKGLNDAYDEEYYDELEESLGVDFDDLDADGIENEQDTDDDGDGVLDTQDNDDDNDGVNDEQDFVEEEYEDDLEDNYDIEESDLDSVEEQDDSVDENIEEAELPEEYSLEPEDCLEDEKYDAVEKICYIECETEEECAKLEEETSKEAEEIGDDFFEGKEEFADAVPEEMTTLANYKIVNEDIKLIEKPEVKANLRQLQDDSEKHKIIWTRFNTLIPGDYRPFLVEFNIGTDGKAETLAAVWQNSENLRNWNIIVDIEDAFAQGNQLEKKELTFTLIHEFGHLHTLNSNQIDTLMISKEQISESMNLEFVSRCKPNYFTEEGCTKKDSYLNLFFERFWKDIHKEWKEMQERQNQEELEKFYQKYKDRFVTDYAATNPEEDIAESWTAFVLQDKPTGNKVVDKKILFFYEFPELVKLRSIIRVRI